MDPPGRPAQEVGRADLGRQGWRRGGHGGTAPGGRADRFRVGLITVTAPLHAGLSLGAPGVYRAPHGPGRRPAPVRLDATGFVGMAFRGPANNPVAWHGWSQFVEVFGGVMTWSRHPGAVPGFAAARGPGVLRPGRSGRLGLPGGAGARRSRRHRPESSSRAGPRPWPRARARGAADWTWAWPSPRRTAARPPAHRDPGRFRTDELVIADIAPLPSGSLRSGQPDHR